MTVTVDLTATGLCIPAKGEHQEMSIFGPNYDKISGVEDAKQGLDEWEWCCDSIALRVDIDDTIQSVVKKVSISAAGVVIDEMESSFEVLLSENDPPEITIWPIGLDHPQFTVSLARLVDEFIDFDIENTDEERAVAFSKWLRTSADRVDANVHRSWRATEPGEAQK